MKIAVVGVGYVGLANGLYLSNSSSENEVTFVDVSGYVTSSLKQYITPIKDIRAQEILGTMKLWNQQVDARLPHEIEEGEKFDMVLVCGPTNYDPRTDRFDTQTVENIIHDYMSRAEIIVIKSTIPVGFTQKMCERYRTDKIVFSPEFLREGNATYDVERPDRAIVGGINEEVCQRVLEAYNYDSTICEVMKPTEAELVKLMSNVYLAMRVSYFNEVDSICMSMGVDASKVIGGVCKDKRIGDHYNNPSFGFGGYCLPKDSKQVRSMLGRRYGFSLLKSIPESNDERMYEIVSKVRELAEKKGTNKIGIYDVAMKSGSDNARESAQVIIGNILVELGYEVWYSHHTDLEGFEAYRCSSVDTLLRRFEGGKGLVLVNRMTKELEEKLDSKGVEYYTRDLYNNN